MVFGKLINEVGNIEARGAGLWAIDLENRDADRWSRGRHRGAAGATEQWLGRRLLIFSYQLRRPKLGEFSRHRCRGSDIVVWEQWLGRGRKILKF